MDCVPQFSGCEFQLKYYYEYQGSQQSKKKYVYLSIRKRVFFSVRMISSDRNDWQRCASACLYVGFANKNDIPISNHIHRQITIWWVMSFEKTSLTGKDLINYHAECNIRVCDCNHRNEIYNVVYRMMKDKQNGRRKKTSRYSAERITSLEIK